MKINLLVDTKSLELESPSSFSNFLVVLLLLFVLRTLSSCNYQGHLANSFIFLCGVRVKSVHRLVVATRKCSSSNAMFIDYSICP